MTDIRVDIDKGYEEARSDLKQVAAFAAALSRASAGRIVSEWRFAIGSFVFGKLCAHTFSVLSLSPPPRGAPGVLWDISSISTLCRSVMDSYFVLYYAAIEPVSEAERSLREAIWTFQAEQKRLALLRLAKSKSAQLPILAAEVERLLQIVTDHPLFASLPPKSQADVRKGEVPILLNNSQLAERRGVSTDYYKSVFRSLSSYVHAHPFCISQLQAFRAGGADELRLIATMLRFCLAFVSLAATDYLTLFPDLPRPSLEVKEIMDTWVFVAQNSSRDAGLQE